MAEQSVVHPETTVSGGASARTVASASTGASASSSTGAVSRDLSYLPESAPPSNHGHTTAAWTTVVVVLVGSTIASVAVLWAVVWLFWAGLAVVALGVVAGKVLQILGHGQGGAATLAKQSRSGGH